LESIVDTREQYAYRFSTHQVVLQRRALPCGDRGVTASERLVAVVERKLLTDLVPSLLNGSSGTCLVSWPRSRSTVVVEDRYSQIFKLSWVRPALVADGLAGLQVRWPTVPIAFCETRQLAEERVYRYLAAARTWANTEHALAERLGTDLSRPEIASAEPAPEPSTAEVRTGPAPPGSGRPRQRTPPPRHMASMARRARSVTEALAGVHG
jgi:hypothetical protein